MILEPVVWVILHCDRCNAPFLDDETNGVVGWTGSHKIQQTFQDLDGLSDVNRWRRYGDRYICAECQVPNEDSIPDWIENPEPFRAIDTALVVRAQALYDAGMLETFSPFMVREWVQEQPGSALKDALTSALDAVFKDRLNDWGPAAGSKAEGEYERAFSVFRAIECELRPSIAATVMGGAE